MGLLFGPAAVRLPLRPRRRTRPGVAAYVRAYMDQDGTPTVEPVPGVDLESYKDRLMERFANPYVHDTLRRLATDASDRIPK